MYRSKNRASYLISGLVVSVFALTLISGCGGNKKDELNLPEQEAKQLKTMEAKKGSGKVEIEEVVAANKAPTTSTGEFKKFYVYADQGYFKNHFIPSGWMGDYGDIKFGEGWPTNPQSRKSSIRVIYTAQRKQGAGWAGIYWQEPANNWGTMKGGYDLTGAKKLTFWARGEKGGEIITEVKMGGINGEFSDSATSSIGPITLSTDWKQYTIDLKDEDLSCVIGGFAFVVSSMENPDGATFYIDEIAYE